MTTTELDRLHSSKTEELKNCQDDLIDYLLSSVSFLESGDLTGWKKAHQTQDQEVLTTVEVTPADGPNSSTHYHDINVCPMCGADSCVEDVVNDIVVCRECCVVVETCILRTDPGHTSIERLKNIHKVKKHLYKRLCHFKEYVQLLMGNYKCNMTDQEEKDLLAILDGNVTPNTVVAGLKKLNLNKKYRKHKECIARKLGGYQLFKMNNPMIWREMIRRFIRVEHVWKYHGKEIAPKRKIFLSYPFVFWQLCHQLGYPEWTQDVVLLKNKKAKTKQFEYWTKVCGWTGWKVFRE